MRIDRTLILIILLLMTPRVIAQETDHAAGHGGQMYHRVRVEAGAGIDGDDAALYDWEFDGRLGTDERKLRLAGEGLYSGGEAEQAELRLLYSHAVAPYWDIHAGIRRDIRPQSTSWLTLGINGLAPYFFETDLHLFANDRGEVAFRLRQENELLLTQRLILRPALEATVYLQDMPEAGAAAGLATLEAGLQLRYEFSREFAPYIAIDYERKIGETGSLAIANGKDRDTIRMTTGLRLLF